MGSSQSTPVAKSPDLIKKQLDPATNAISNSSSTSTSTSTADKKKMKSPPQNLAGFDLIQYKCRKKKRTYDLCHSSKHKAFVNGKKLQDQEGDELSCDELFDIYKDCIYKGMQQDRKKRGLASPTEESALGTFAEYADEE